jgi:hypothetical protein
MRSPARTQLAAAQERLTEANAALEAAQATHDRGKAFVDDARAALEAIGGEERAQGGALAAAIKAALKEGREPPAVAAADQGQRRAGAQAELAAREEAGRLLAAELQEASQAVEAAKRQADLAVHQVLLEEAMAATEAGQKALEDLRRAQRRLMGVERGGGFSAVVRAFPMPREAIELLHIETMRSNPIHDGAIAGEWKAFRAALLEAPDAVAPTGDAPDVKPELPITIRPAPDTARAAEQAA